MRCALLCCFRAKRQTIKQWSLTLFASLLFQSRNVNSSTMATKCAVRCSIYRCESLRVSMVIKNLAVTLLYLPEYKLKKSFFLNMT